MSDDKQTLLGAFDPYERAARTYVKWPPPQPTIAATKAEALREAAEEFATGAWNDAFMEGDVEDDVSAVRATEAWLMKRADQIEGKQNGASA